MTEQRFLQTLADIRDYWCNVAPQKNTKETVDGVIFSILCLFDGVSGANNCTPITLVNGVDSKYGSIINRHFDELHAEWSKYR